MIIDAFFALLFGFLQFILGLLPSFSDPGWADPEIAAAAGNFGDRAQIVDFFLPLDVLVQVVTVLLGAWLLAYGVRAVLWVYSKVPGKAT